MRRLSVRGFIVIDFAARWEEATSQLIRWEYRSGLPAHVVLTACQEFSAFNDEIVLRLAVRELSHFASYPDSR
jgi:hypothetical protein